MKALRAPAAAELLMSLRHPFVVQELLLEARK